MAAYCHVCFLIRPTRYAPLVLGLCLLLLQRQRASSG
jgi:hypothetical protein